MNRTEYERASRQYLAALPSMKKSVQTIRCYQSVLSAFRDFLFSDEQNRTDAAEQISPITIGAWRNQMFQNVSINTIRHYMTVLSAFFRWCVRMGAIEKSPIESAEIPKKEQIEYDLLSLDEIKRVLSANAHKLGENYCKNRAIVVLLIQTGIRNAELRDLRLSDLDFDRNTITVSHGKGDKKREIPFPALAREAVSEYLSTGARPGFLKEKDLLFPSFADETGHGRTNRTERNRFHKFSSAAILQMVKRYTERVCGHEVGVHDLRHAYASMCDYFDVPIRQIQTSMGHSSYNTTLQVYISVLDKNKAAENINSAFDAMERG